MIASRNKRICVYGFDMNNSGEVALKCMVQPIIETFHKATKVVEYLIATRSKRIIRSYDFNIIN